MDETPVTEYIRGGGVGGGGGGGWATPEAANPKAKFGGKSKKIGGVWTSRTSIFRKYEPDTFSLKILSCCLCERDNF